MENQYDPRRPAGIVRDEFELVRVSPDGGTAAKIGRFAGAEWLIYDHTASFRSTQLPMGRQGHVAVSEDHIVYGSSDSTKLAVYDTAGRRVRTVELPVAERKLTPREVRSELEGIEDGAERAALKRYFDANSASREAPAFSDLRADRSGRLWVRTTNPASPGVAHWIVVKVAGGAVGSVALPADALLLDIPSPSAVLVREVDADGVLACGIVLSIAAALQLYTGARYVVHGSQEIRTLLGTARGPALVFVVQPEDCLGGGLRLAS